MSILSIQNVTVKHQQQILLHHISLDVNALEHWLFVGHSGSGKTTMLDTIAGKLHPASGTITTDLKKTGISQIHTNSPITILASKHNFKDLTNTGNLYYQQRFNSADSDQALSVLQHLNLKLPDDSDTSYWTIDNVVELLQLEPLLYKEVIKLSNGETKRLRLAAALLSQPSILLLDDPLSGLDYETQLNFNNILKKIIDGGTTIIMSGSGNEIPSVITHVAIFENGTISKTIPVQDYSPEISNTADFINKKQIQYLTASAISFTYEWIVKMTNVTIKYNDLKILDGVNWQIKPTERWALFGHNGAGKSTLLSLINGDNPQAYANEIILFDKKRGTGESIWDIKSKIGFLSPELYQYFPTDQSGLQVVESGYYDTQGLFRPSHPAKAAKAMEWMKVLQIDNYARQLLKNMPASAQRLCLLARALIKNPQLLILDEPCQGLDKQQRIHFNALIDAVAESTRLTLIYVTHYAEQLPNCVDKFLTLKKGTVVN